MATPRVIKKTRQPTYPKIPAINFGSYTQRGITKHANFAAPRAPTAPTPTATASSAANIGGVQAASNPDPRDATYFNDIAKLDQYYGSQKANLDAADSQAARDLALSNKALDDKLPQDRLAASVNANKSGLFYSGFLGKNLGEIEKSYAERRTSLQNAYSDAVGSRARQRQDLEANFGANGLNRQSILLEAASRAAQSAAPAADPGPVAAAPAAAGGGVTKVAVSDKLGGRWLYRQNANGTWTPVRRMM